MSERRIVYGLGRACMHLKEHQYNRRVMIAINARAGGLDPRFHGASSYETRKPSELESLDLAVILVRPTDLMPGVTHHALIHQIMRRKVGPRASTANLQTSPRFQSTAITVIRQVNHAHTSAKRRMTNCSSLKRRIPPFDLDRWSERVLRTPGGLFRSPGAGYVSFGS